MIGFLLVGFSSISQTGIPKDSVVVLTEKQAKAVASDLVRFDAAKQIIKIQEERIKNFQVKEIEFESIVKTKDSIIQDQTNHIKVQGELIKKEKFVEFHTYAGIQSYRFTLDRPMLYTNFMVEFIKLNVGIQYFVQPNNPSGYSIIVEYKIF